MIITDKGTVALDDHGNGCVMLTLSPFLKTKDNTFSHALSPIDVGKLLSVCQGFTEAPESCCDGELTVRPDSSGDGAGLEFSWYSGTVPLPLPLTVTIRGPALIPFEAALTSYCKQLLKTPVGVKE